MQLLTTCKPVYKTLKNGKTGNKIIKYEAVSREVIYTEEDLDEHENVKPITKKQKKAAAEKLCMAVTGMSADEYARKIFIDYNNELKANNSNI